MNSLRVGGLTPFTTIDFPGRLSAVVWCQGCPLRCRYCHNGHLLKSDAPPVHRWDEVLSFLHRRRGLLDAVVFSGGEPTLQKALPQAIADVQSLGYGVGLHTAGCYPDRLAGLLDLVDWVGLDIKALPEDYAAVTGVAGSGESAWQSLELLLESGVAHELRVTVHDDLLPPARVETLARRLASRGADAVVLQRCDTRHTLDPGLGAQRRSWTGDGFVGLLKTELPRLSLRA